MPVLGLRSTTYYYITLHKTTSKYIVPEVQIQAASELHQILFWLRIDSFQAKLYEIKEEYEGTYTCIWFESALYKKYCAVSQTSGGACGNGPLCKSPETNKSFTQ